MAPDATDGDVDTLKRKRADQIIELGGIRFRVLESERGTYVYVDGKRVIEDVGFISAVPTDVQGEGR